MDLVYISISVLILFLLVALAAFGSFILLFLAFFFSLAEVIYKAWLVKK